MDAVVLVGGEGTRLRSEVPDLPKPLAPVGGKPFLEILLAWLDRFGMLERAILTSGHRGDQMESFARENASRWSFELTSVREETLLGTGGGLRAALVQTRGDETLVLNGDSFLACDPARLVRTSGGEVRAVLAAARVPDASRFGTLELKAPSPGEPSAVRRFREKGGSGPGWINGGVYVFRREPYLEATPAGQRFSLEQDVLARWAERSPGSVAAVPFPDAAFLDIGEPESYRRSIDFFKEQGLL